LDEEIETITLKNQATDDPNLSFAKPPEVIPTKEEPSQEQSSGNHSNTSPGERVTAND